MADRLVDGTIHEFVVIRMPEKEESEVHITKSARRVTMGLLAIPLIYLFIWRILPMLYTAFLSMTDYNMIWDKNRLLYFLIPIKKFFPTILSLNQL